MLARFDLFLRWLSTNAPLITSILGSLVQLLGLTEKIQMAGRVQRIRMKGIHAHKGVLDLELPSQEGDVYVWVSAPCEVVLSFVSNSGIVLPVQVATKIDQTFNVDEEVVSLRIAPADKNATFGFSVKASGTRYRDIVNPIPDRVPVVLDENSFQHRVMRAVQAHLDALGIRSDNTGRGQRYSSDEDFEDDDGYDDEFGRGYQYDETVEEDIERAAQRVVSERMQRRKPSDPSSKPVSDDDPAPGNDDDDRTPRNPSPDRDPAPTDRPQRAQQRR